MIDESLINIVECWDGFSWYDRKLIWWKCIKHKHSKDSNLAISVIATLLAFLVLMIEPHPERKAGLLVAVGLLYFYTILVDYIYKRVYS